MADKKEVETAGMMESERVDLWVILKVAQLAVPLVAAMA